MADSPKDANVRVNIEGDISGLKTATGQAKPMLQDLGKDVDLIKIAFGGVAAAAASYVGLQATMLVQHVNLAAATADLTQKYGVSAEELSSMSVGMVTGSTNAETLGQGMKFLSGRMLEANAGNKEAIRIFDALGIEWADSTGKLKPLNTMIEEVATRFAGMEDGAGKVGLASKLLGSRVGEQLIPYLNQGGDALRELRREAESLGLVISTQTAKDANDLSNNWKVLKLGAGELAREITGPLIRALVEVSRAMRDARKEGDGWFTSTIKGLREAAIQATTMEPRARLEKLKEDEKKLIETLRAREAMGDGKIAPKFQQEMTSSIRKGLIENYRRQAEIEDFLYATETSSPPPTAAPDLSGKDGKTGKTGRPPRAPVDHEAENSIRRLSEQLAVLNGEKSETEKLDRLLLVTKKQWTPLQEEEAYLIAGEIDEKKKLNKEAEVALRLLAKQEAAEQAATAAAEAHHNALRKEAQAIEESVNPFQRLSRETERLRELVDQGVISWETYYEAVSQASEKAGHQVKTMADASDDITRAVKDAIESNARSVSRELANMAVSGTYSFRSLGDAARNFVQELLAIQIQKRTIDPLLKLGTGFLDNLLAPSTSQLGRNQATADDWMLAGLPGRASGGPVFAGRGYMVGENGPEPFFPRTDGMILPNGVLGAQNVRVEIVNESGLKMQVTDAQPQLDVDGMVVRVWLNDLRTNGPISQAMDRRLQQAF